MRDAIKPHALPSALDGFPGARVLSLDCFDTLLWRDSHAPADIFALLPGTTALQRGWAERRARQAAAFGRNCNEVSIGEIYAQLLPNAAPAEREAAIAAEIAAEARHCFAFAPTVELMRVAKQRGLQVIIVSDTYLDANQLRVLISHAAGEEVAGLIDRLFCSSTYGKAKAGGLYGEVLRKLSAKPHEIVHIGDNKRADVDGVAPFGVNTLHLEQFAPATEQRLRHEAAVSALLHPASPDAVTAQQPHRAALALTEPQLLNPAESLGFTVIGPVLYGFERWLRAEAEALQAAHGGTVHWLFLLRDGYLPLRMHEAVGEGAPAHAVEISRYAAIASSFRREADVLRYVELELGTNPGTLAKQLLMPNDEIERLLADRTPQDASMELLRQVRKASVQRDVAVASRAYGKRLAAHVEGLVHPAEGDTVMLIDLGYNGSVQNGIAALLQKELKVHVAGRYLLLREQDRPGLDKRGFIGVDHYDAHSLEAMCANVAVLEQVCTIDMGSVIDYAADGTPIRRGNDIKAQQSATRAIIQAGCLRFAQAQRAAVIRREPGDEIALWRRGATAVLGRVMYLPDRQELAAVESFEHDVNLGTDRTVALFDRDVARRGLRQRGLFYLNGSQRMYLPAELHGHGLAPKLTLLAHKRFGLPFSFGDFSDSSISVPVIFADRDQVTQGDVQAVATHDGFYLAAVPIGDCRYSVALQFGALFDWLQVDSVSIVPVDGFLGERAADDSRHLPVAPAFDGMEQVSPELMRCTDEAGFMMIHPPQRLDDTPMLVAVVFRPISERQTPATAVQGAGALA